MMPAGYGKRKETLRYTPVRENLPLYPIRNFLFGDSATSLRTDEARNRRVCPNHPIEDRNRS